MSHKKPRSFNQKKQSYYEITNSLSWLFLDACWMFDYEILSYLFIIPTVVSGLVLSIKDPDPNTRKANFGILLWALMNITWMCSDYWKSPDLLIVAKVLLPSGLIFITYALYKSQNKKELLKSIQRFRRIKNK